MTVIINHKFEGSAAFHGSNKNYVLPGNNNLHQRFLLSKVTTTSYDKGSNRKSAHTIIPLFINMNHSSPESTNQTDNIKKNLYYKGDTIYIIPNSSDYNNYNARKNYIEKTTYVEEKEEKANNHNITVFPILSYHIFEGPIKIKLTTKDAKNNIHGEFKPNSSFSNSIEFSRDNNKIWNKFIFRYLPISMFKTRSMLYNKIKLYPGISRYLIYFLPDRYFNP